MDNYELGDTLALESFLHKSRSRHGTAASLDLIDGLDLDFLAVMKGNDELSLNLCEENEDALDGSLHDFFIPYANSHDLSYTSLNNKSNTNRRMSFDSLFEPLSFDQHRSESVSSMGLALGLPTSSLFENSDSDFDKTVDFFKGESPYIRMARSLEAKNGVPSGIGRSTRQRARRDTSDSHPPLPMSTRRTVERPVRKTDGRPTRRLDVGIAEKKTEDRPPRRMAEVPTKSESLPPPPRLSNLELSALNKTPSTAVQALQLPKHSMADGPPLSKIVGAYSKENRKERIERFLAKRDRRVWTKRVKYDVRKNFADSRVRVKGRFVKKEAEDVLKQLLDPVATAESEIAHAG